MTTITLTNLENGVLLIGDLWDVRSSKRVGFNLFGKNITTAGGETLKDQLDVNPGKGIGKFEFIHVKDSNKGVNSFKMGAEINCELLGGIIKIAGGLDFEIGWSNEMSTEELVQVIECPCHEVGLKEGESAIFKPLLDAHVTSLLKEGKLGAATHVVKSMEVGGRMAGSIKITQTKKGDTYKVGFFLEGEANLIMLSGKMSANASVGEDIMITNYQSTIKLTSMPPVPAPTKIEDFSDSAGDASEISTVGKNFSESLSNERGHFEYWEKISTTNIIGIPIKFTLVPINALYIPEPDPVEPDPEESVEPGEPGEPDEPIPESAKKHPKASKADPKPTLESFQTCLEKLRDWISTDFLKRSILNKLERCQQIIDEETHEQSIKVAARQTALRNESESKRLMILQDYLTYKNNPDAGLVQFDEKVNALLQEHDITEEQLETFQITVVEACKKEIMGLNITFGADPPDKDSDKPVENPLEDEEFKKEEQSPLIFFTNETALNSWLQTQRFSKLLYKTSVLDPELELVPGGTESISQMIYLMAKDLGSIYMQPGVAYPTLTAEVRKTAKTKSKADAFCISTPNGLLTYSDDVEGRKHIEFIINLFKTIIGGDGSNQFAIIGRLYNTYCEIHGLKLNITNPMEVIPIIEFIQGVFGQMNIQLSLPNTQAAISEKDELTILFTMDGVQSSRQVVHALLQLQQMSSKDGNNALCGTFEITDKHDAPPLFIIWDKKPQAVCLDYLGLLILLDSYKNKEWDIKKIEKYLGMSQETMEVYPLCSTVRLEFAKHVRGIPMSKSFTELEMSSSLEDDVTPNYLVGITTAVLNATVKGPISLAEEFTKYTIDIFNGAITILHFFDGHYSISATDEKEWSDVEETLENFWAVWSDDKLVEQIHKYYKEITTLFNDYTAYGMDISIPGNSDASASDKVDPPSSSDLKETIESTLKDFDAVKSFDFKTQLTYIATIISSPSINNKGCAKMYATALLKELGYLEKQDIKFPAIENLKQIISSIQKTAKVSNQVIDEVMKFVFDAELPSGEEIEPEVEFSLQPEVVARIKSNLEFRRYYHVLNDLVENSPENFEHKDLHKYQLETNRLTSIKDWLNVIRLIEVIAKFVDSTKEQIWRNVTFQYLMYANLDNPFVLKTLAKAFVNVKEHSVPKYIPGDIARLLLALDLSPEGNPIGFDPEWKSRKVLLKSLQVLWVLQIIPDQFQTYLLKNVLDKDGSTFTALEESESLFYWNVKDKYFEQIWDLNTIHAVILNLLKHPAELRSKTKRRIQQTVSSKKNVSRNIAEPSETEAITVSDYLKMQKSAGGDTMQDMNKWLYQLKVGKMADVELEQSPFAELDRVDILSKILTKTATSLRNELLSITTQKNANNFALPLITQSGPSNYTGLRLKFLQYGNQDSELPKIITAIRIGENSQGKSQFLNAIVTENKDAFASKANSTSGKIPEFLNGYVDAMEMSQSTSNEQFWQTMPKENFIIVNLHGNALELADHLKYLQLITSCFLVFWGPQDLNSIQEKMSKLMDIIKPNHGAVHLYIDPIAEVAAQVDKNAIITTPFSLLLGTNLNNASNAITTALIRRARQPKNFFPTLETITFPNGHLKAQEFSDWIKQVGVNRIKGSLLLQKGRSQWTIEELECHWNNDPNYSQLIQKLLSILQLEDEFLEIFCDLGDLLTPLVEDVHTQAWKNLFKISYQDFGHMCYGSSLVDPLKRQILLSQLQNNVDDNRLSLMEIMIEVCKVWELSPGKLPGIQPPADIMARLFEASHSMPIPSVPNVGFFEESWSKDFINSLNDMKILVVSCLGQNPFEISEVTNSIFGISFSSSAARCQWSDSPWSGIQMKLVHFSTDIITETSVNGILLLQAKPQGQETVTKNISLQERDRQISAFLMSLSNLTMLFDYKDIQPVLESSFIGMNKMDIHIKTPQLFFVGIHNTQIKEDISAMLNKVKTFEEEWIDYNDVSNLGIRVVQQAIDDLNVNDGVGSIFDIVKQQTLIPLSDAVIAAAMRNKDRCPYLKEFLIELGSTWDYIRDEVKFPYPDFTEMERSKIFQEKLWELLDAVDECFTYHVNDFSQKLFEGMTNIVNAWRKNGAGELEIDTKKEMLWTEVSNNVNFILTECKLKSKETDGDEGICTFCEEQRNLEAEIFDDKWWGDEGLETQFTKIKLKEMVQSYVYFEAWHYINLTRQMMTAKEDKLLQQEDETYKEDDNSEFEPDVQRMSLERRIVNSERRLLQETDSIFPDKDLGWEDYDANYTFMNSAPAFENDELLDSGLQAQLKPKLGKIPENQLANGGWYGIFQSGSARRTVAEVNGILQTFIKYNLKGKKLLKSFELRVICCTIWRLNDKLCQLENIWMADNDPLQIYLDAPKLP